MILSLSPNFCCNCFTLGIAARQGPHQEAQKSMKLYLPGTMISFKLIDFLSGGGERQILVMRAFENGFQLA